MDRQKKLLIFALAWLSAAVLTWFLYTRTVVPQQDRKVQVVVASHDLPLGTLLRKQDLKLVPHLERDVPKGVVFQSKDAENRVLLVPVNSNEPVLLSKLSGPTTAEGMPSTIDPGFRAVSVTINDASGVAGLVQANSRVDVLFTRPGSMAEATTSIILQNVKVLSTGRSTPTGQTVDTRTPRSPVVTLLLTPPDAQKLELAKNQGKISLSLRNPLDTSQAADNGPMSTDVLDPAFQGRSAAAKKKARTAGRGVPGNSPVWEELTAEQKIAQRAAEERKKKEEEKPRVVVDVYRGDKHVQELFK
jgi:pilus assembly protein CpaB